MASGELVVLGCSATKRPTNGLLPAIDLYDGPIFRVLRSYLREYVWPERLSVAVLSAKYGVIGGLAPIRSYDQRMTAQRAAEMAERVTRTLQGWSAAHRRTDLVLGHTYLGSVGRQFLDLREQVRVVEGSIGIKLNWLHGALRAFGKAPRRRPVVPPNSERPLYFLPDWDDFLDVAYDFDHDVFSNVDRNARHEEHSIALMRPQRLSDGILVSLAQNLGSKGLLRRVALSDESCLAPQPVRQHFSLGEDQWAFGDCGAFSYVAEHDPTISVEQAVSLYDLYQFDLGASVDHIPVPSIPTAEGQRSLSDHERRRRVRLTRDNADRFIRLHRERGARFIPVGVLQGLGPVSYANQVGEYMEMGYAHLAIGGLVPRADPDVLQVVRAVNEAVKGLKRRPWVHLLGVFRPSLQPSFRELGIASFDSATYFRKAWLRSDQNYLGVDGRWYAAIRVPPLNDPRTRLRLKTSGEAEDSLRRLERHALLRLREFDRGTATVDNALEAVVAYDRLLDRSELVDARLIAAYRRTLESKPWKRCPCPMCQSLGIEVLIFRGLNRNKRRGAHNTLQLFGQLQARGARLPEGKEAGK